MERHPILSQAPAPQAHVPLSPQNKQVGGLRIIKNGSGGVSHFGQIAFLIGNLIHLHSILPCGH